METVVVFLIFVLALLGLVVYLRKAWKSKESCRNCKADRSACSWRAKGKC